MKLIIAGGGTGGHLFPGIAVAEEFLSRDSSNKVLFAGSERGIEAKLIPRLGYQLELISAAGIKGKGMFAKLSGAVQLLYGYAQSRTILKQFKPDLVLGVGGYASLPMVMAAKGMNIPRFIHEQNALPGLANRFLSKFADKVFISIEESGRFFPLDKVILTGNPLRKQILSSLEPDSEKTSAGGAENDKFQLFIFGGSQGARALNQIIPEAVALMQGKYEQLQVVHQTGEADLTMVRDKYQQAGINADVQPFIDDMARQYHQADLIICRSGATTIAEITAVGKTCLFVPFPHATDDHQRKNAEALLKKNACLMMQERNMTPESIAVTVEELINNREKLNQIAANAAALASLNAAGLIVDQMQQRVVQSNL